MKNVAFQINIINCLHLKNFKKLKTVPAFKNYLLLIKKQKAQKCVRFQKEFNFILKCLCFKKNVDFFQKMFLIFKNVQDFKNNYGFQKIPEIVFLF